MAAVATRQTMRTASTRRAPVRRYRSRLTASRHGFAALILALVTVCALGIATSGPASAQSFTYNPRPPRPAPPRVANDGQMLVQAVAVDVATTAPVSAQGFTYNPQPPRPKPPRTANDGQMLVQAVEVDYDYNNSRVSAVGNVQMFYNGTSVEADKVIYDQKTKRLHAEGNIRMTDADGKITYAEIMDLSDDYRDGFVDSLRVDTADATRMAATRADRSGAHPGGPGRARVRTME